MENAPKQQFEFSDMHVHLQDRRFGDAWNEVAQYIDRAKEQGVTKFLCAGTSPADWNRVAELGRRFGGVYAAFGVHPWYVGKISGEWAPILENLLRRYVAQDGTTRACLGEVGLDFAVRGCDEALRKEQEETLRTQLNIAVQEGTPVVLHSVRANERILKIMREYSKTPVWLLHGWTASPQEVEQAVELGAFFSFSQRALAPTAAKARKTLEAVPRDRLLLESDGPHLIPPRGYDGAPDAVPEIYVEQRSPDGRLLAEPASLVLAAQEVCALRKMKPDEFFEQLAINEKRFLKAIPQKAD